MGNIANPLISPTLVCRISEKNSVINLTNRNIMYFCHLKY